MNEKEYLIATNRAKISMALGIMRDVLGGENFGISEKEVRAITRLLADAEGKLFKIKLMDNG